MAEDYSKYYGYAINIATDLISYCVNRKEKQVAQKRKTAEQREVTRSVILHHFAKQWHLGKYQNRNVNC